MKKLLRIVLIIIIILGGFFALIRNPQWSISRKLFSVPGLEKVLVGQLDPAAIFCEQNGGRIEVNFLAPDAPFGVEVEIYPGMTGLETIEDCVLPEGICRTNIASGMGNVFDVRRSDDVICQVNADLSMTGNMIETCYFPGVIGEAWPYLRGEYSIPSRCAQYATGPDISRLLDRIAQLHDITIDSILDIITSTGNQSVTDKIDTKVDLTNCISYFDGCNDCLVQEGKASLCTTNYCTTLEAPKCIQYSTPETKRSVSPASTYCVKNGGIITLDGPIGSERGTCTFPDGRTCDESKYMSTQGKCR